MDQVISELAKLGLPGLMIAWLIWNNMGLSKRLDEVMEKRVGESRECLDALHTTSAAIDANTRATQALAETLTVRRVAR